MSCVHIVSIDAFKIECSFHNYVRHPNSSPQGYIEILKAVDVNRIWNEWIFLGILKSPIYDIVLETFNMAS